MGYLPLEYVNYVMYSIIGGSPLIFEVVLIRLFEDKIRGSFVLIIFHTTRADLLLISYNLTFDGGDGGSAKILNKKHYHN
jgi:hypothetical protein